MPRRRPAHDPPDLRALSQRVASGDRAAFDAVHERLGGGLRRLFERRVAGRAEIAEELAQQTWSRAWEAVRQGRYDPDRAAISTFVYAVANNVWLQFCRTPASRGEAAAIEPFAAPQDPAALLHYVELLEALRGCLSVAGGANALSAEEREVLLAAAHGETERQLALRLGLAASTINARKQSGYAKIRACLAVKGFTAEIVEQMGLSYE